MRTKFVTVPDVEVLQTTDAALRCRVAGREVWVPLAQAGIADHAVRKPGDRGPLAIPSWLARELRLDGNVR